MVGKCRLSFLVEVLLELPTGTIPDAIVNFVTGILVHLLPPYVRDHPIPCPLKRSWFAKKHSRIILAYNISRTATHPRAI